MTSDKMPDENCLESFDVQKMLETLRKPVDHGGYDGYSPDKWLVRVAFRLEQVYNAFKTEQTMHNAWRKRAEEAEASTLPQQPAGDRARALEGKRGINGCMKTAPAALRFLAKHDRPAGGEQTYNSMHLEQIANEIEKTAALSAPQEQPTKRALHPSMISKSDLDAIAKAEVPEQPTVEGGEAIKGRYNRLMAIGACKDRNEIARLMEKDLGIPYLTSLAYVDGIQAATRTKMEREAVIKFLKGFQVVEKGDGMWFVLDWPDVSKKVMFNLGHTERLCASTVILFEESRKQCLAILNASAEGK